MGGAMAVYLDKGTLSAAMLQSPVIDIFRNSRFHFYMKISNK